MKTIYDIKKTIKNARYIYALTEPIHPKANLRGFYPLHRIVIENYLGRKLKSSEIVHHKDENKLNNELSNLEVMTQSSHGKLHHPRNPEENVKCDFCGSIFHPKKSVLRHRKKEYKTNSCSKKCQYSLQVKTKFTILLPKIQKLRDNGLSYSEIQKSLGVPKGSITYLLKYRKT